MDKEVLDFQKTVINGLKERYLDWNIKAQDNDTCNIILQVTTDDGWYGTINLSNLYEQHHDEELTIDDAMKSPPPCGDITPMEVVSNSRAEPQS